MAKISELPEVLDPNGAEQVIVLKDGRAQRAALSGLVSQRLDTVAQRFSLGIGEQISVVSFAGEVLNGGVLIQSGGKNVGYTIPAGATGALSYTRAQIALSAAQALALAGATVRIKTVATVTANFLTEKKLLDNAVQAVTSGLATVTVGTITRSEQIGTKLYREAVVKIDSDWRLIGLPLQVSDTKNVATNAHSLQVSSVTMVVEDMPGLATNGADYALQRRLDELAAPIEEAVASNTTAITEAKALAAAGRITSGDQPLSHSVGQALNGGVMIAGPAGAPNYVGYTIAAGSSGLNTYITARVQLTAALRTALTGRTIRLKAVGTATAEFARRLNASAVNVDLMAGGQRQNQGRLVRAEQVGTTLYREATYTVVGDEAYLGLVIQTTTSSTTGNHSFQLTSLSYSIEAVPVTTANTPDDEQLALRLDAYFAAQGLTGVGTTLAAKRFGFANRLAELTPAPQYFNGAVARVGADGRNWGWTVPAGQTGTTTLMQFTLPLQGLGSLLAGRRVRVTIGMDTSDNYAQFGGAALQVTRPGGDTNLATSTVSNTQVSTNRRMWSFEATLDGTETTLKPYFSRGTQSAAAADQFILVTDISLEIVSTPSDTTTVMEENLRLGSALRSSVLSSALTTAYSTAITAALSSGTGYAATITVKADGTGNFTHPKDAVASITDASANKRYRVLIYPGIYSGQANWNCKDYVDLVGTDRATCIITYENPDNVAVGTIPNTQTIWCNTETKLENLTITIRNGRYPVHSDSSGNLKGRTQRVFNCHIEHLGNDGARAYQTSIGGNPALVWASEHAWGYGSSSAMTVLMDKGTTLKSKVSALYLHTREDFAEPSVMDVRNIRAITTGDTTTAVTVQPLGSNRNDLLLINNCEFMGDFSYAAVPWIQTTLAYQPANHAEVAVMGAGNTPMVFRTSDFGRALKIESADTTNASAVTVSGSAVASIMGEVVSTPGSGGLKGYAFGKFDVSGTPVGLASNTHITALGQRLGDCTGTPKVLTLSFQGGGDINVMFNQNYASTITGSVTGATLTATAVAGRPLEVGMVVGLGNQTRTIASLGTGTGGAGTYNLSSAPSADLAAGSTIPAYVANGTILAAINAALGSAGTASLYAVGERFRPSILDEEKALRNNSAVGIPMGSAVAFDYNNKTIRLMTSSDPASRFAGIAWEDIYPGQLGRVKVAGYLAVVDLLRTDAAAFAFGDTFSVDPANPGKVYKGGTQGLLSAIRPDAVRVA